MLAWEATVDTALIDQTIRMRRPFDDDGNEDDGEYNIDDSESSLFDEYEDDDKDEDEDENE